MSRNTLSSVSSGSSSASGSKDLKKISNHEDFLSAVHSNVVVIKHNVEYSVKGGDITFGLSKAGKFDLWLKHSQLMDSVNEHVGIVLDAVLGREKKSKVLKKYEALLKVVEQYNENWVQVDRTLRGIKT
ncbi:hypothetical protein TRVA0_033S00650 [Trichomonascus vanleenenianus]|uniref:uncharacterized protein n=1 Tax=Trichomonascus vanleenenianus TaxID=2268995 RepID=UPI003ECACD30